MSLTAGAITAVNIQPTSAIMAVATATSGTAPYVSYQWYRSTTAGFSPGPSNILTGQVAQTLNDSGLIPNSTYYYRNIVTDSASPAATSDATQVSIVTTPSIQSQNQFSQAPIVGQPDLNFNYNTKSAIVDVSIGAGLIFPGQAVKIVANTQGGAPRVVPCTGITDNVWGFAMNNIKNQSYALGNKLEVNTGGNVLWLYATGAITQGAQCCLDTSQVAAVQATGATATVVGYALDGAAAAGALIRVELKTPSFATA